MDQFKFDKIKSQIYSNEYVLTLASFLEEKTGAKSDHIILGFMALVLIMLFTGFGAALVCHVASFFYPVLQTISYIEVAQASSDSKRVNKEELMQWLVYWVLLALMNLCEAFKSTVLHWVPIYYPLKLSVVMWLMLPQCEGAKQVYHYLAEHARARHSKGKAHDKKTD